MPAQKTPLYLSRVRLENVRSLKSVDLSFDDGASYRKMSVFIGKNGAGKSSVLRAIAVGLCPQKEAGALISELSGDFIRKNKRGKPESAATIRLELRDPDDFDASFWIETVVRRNDSGQEILEQSHEPQTFPWERIFVCGYGVNRGSTRYEPIDGYRSSDAVQTLFREDAGLLDPEAVLRMLKLAEHEDGGNQVYQSAIRSLKKVLQLNPNHQIEVTSKSVLVHGPWAAMPFHALGDGYRGTAGWLLDLLGRAYQADFDLVAKGALGIVLLDEMDEHLHPVWQRELAPLLKKLFPNVQFVGTTHAPMTIVNQDAGEIFACDLANAVGKIEQKPSPSGKNADDILRGEWFNLTSTFDNETKRLLDKYKKAVRLGDIEQRDDLRRQLRDRMGHLIATPLDEVAMEIAGTLRDKVSTMSEADKLAAIKAGFERYRKR